MAIPLRTIDRYQNAGLHLVGRHTRRVQAEASGARSPTVGRAQKQTINELREIKQSTQVNIKWRPTAPSISQK